MREEFIWIGFLSTALGALIFSGDHKVFVICILSYVILFLASEVVVATLRDRRNERHRRRFD